MIGVEDIAPEIMDKTGHAGNDPLTVLAVDQQNNGVFSLYSHVVLPCLR